MLSWAHLLCDARLKGKRKIEQGNFKCESHALKKGFD